MLFSEREKKGPVESSWFLPVFAAKWQDWLAPQTRITVHLVFWGDVMALASGHFLLVSGPVTVSLSWSWFSFPTFSPHYPGIPYVPPQRHWGFRALPQTHGPRYLLLPLLSHCLLSCWQRPHRGLLEAWSLPQGSLEKCDKKWVSSLLMSAFCSVYSTMLPVPGLRAWKFRAHLAFLVCLPLCLLHPGPGAESCQLSTPHPILMAENKSLGSIPPGMALDILMGTKGI